MLPQFAGVVINKKIEATDRIYTYIIPASLQGILQCGMAVRVPFGNSLAEGVVAELFETTEVNGLKPIARLISDKPLFDADMLKLSSFISEYYLCPRAAALQAMLPSGLQLTGKLPPSKSVNCFYPTAAQPLFSARDRKQQAAYALIHAKPGISRAELEQAGFSMAVIKKLLDKGYAQMRRERLYAEEKGNYCEEARLSAEQEGVYQGLLELLESKGSHTALLHGVTGSGKTEIYIKLAQYVINAGKQVLILVPEIALTPQMVDFISRRLQVRVAVMHSAMSAVERRNTWQGISEGEYAVVLGARSAVFAPLHNIGLIVMDEEQESSYKQENVPRFHTGELAARRAELADALLLLGSATPSVESYYRAMKGEYSLFTLKERFHRPQLPEVSIIDMRQELMDGNRSMLSKPLQTAIADRLAKGEQSLLFLNRRGFFTFYSCRACGGTVKCSHCSVPLAYHEREGRLKCHYCGHTEEVKSICPHCGSSMLKSFGTGTQRVVAEVARLFPEARILRLDTDVTARQGAHEQIYRSMLRHEADILVGTQMIAKGLDFPLVTLAAVLAADSQLNLPDWRAPERAFQLFTQLIGRAGRREKRGEAIIQSYNPDSYIIQAAAAQDYKGFYEKELLMREIAGNSPYSAMISLLFQMEDLPQLELICATARDMLKSELGESAFISGPIPAPVERIKDKWRRQILLKSEALAALREAVNAMLCGLTEHKLHPKELQILIDVEPMEL